MAAGQAGATTSAVPCGQPPCDVPRWALRLLYRLAQLQRGQAYTLTLLMVGDEPVWTVQQMGKVENGK